MELYGSEDSSSNRDEENDNQQLINFEEVNVELNPEVEPVNQNDNAAMEKVIRSKKGMRPHTPFIISTVAKQGKELYKTLQSKRGVAKVLIEKYPQANLSRSTIRRWCFEWSEKKLEDVLRVSKRHKGEIRLPAHIKAMSQSRIQRDDLETKVYMNYRFRKDVQKRHIDFSWFMRQFKDFFQRENLPAPSKNKILGFLKRREISLQSVRDRKSKTVEQRIDQIRDQFCRLDEFQRQSMSDPKYGRVPPGLM